MESIHKPNEMPFVSDLINVREFVNEVLGQAASDFQTAEAASMAELLGCSEDDVKGLEEVCSIENLKWGVEIKDTFSPDIPDSSLVTLHIQKEELNKRNNNPSYKQMAMASLKFRRINFDLKESLTAQNSVANSDPFKAENVILTVHLMRPYNRPLLQHELRLGRLMGLDSTFLVLGSNNLTQLRDKISCLSDFAVNEDYSANPDMPQDTVAKDIYKSGFFFIHDTFYDDMREASAEELSKVIIEWSTKGDRGLGSFKNAKMEATTFEDLTLRLGQPYLYQHQGSCEHLMVISDIRLMDKDDCQNIADYPLQISYKVKRRMFCCGCKVYTARWVTHGNSRLPFDPGFFCDSCFRSFCYDAEGKKIGQFTAVPYFDRQGFY